MNTRFIFCLLSLCCLLLISTLNANSKVLASEAGVTLYANDVPFKRPNGTEQEYRSIPVAVPIYAFTSENHSIELDFFQPVGEIEITISYDGVAVYSSSENIETPTLKSIPLPEELSGNFMIEIKGSNGAYAYGNFNLN